MNSRDVMMFVWQNIILYKHFCPCCDYQFTRDGNRTICGDWEIVLAHSDFGTLSKIMFQFHLFTSSEVDLTYFADFVFRVHHCAIGFSDRETLHRVIFPLNECGYKALVNSVFRFIQTWENCWNCTPNIWSHKKQVTQKFVIETKVDECGELCSRSFRLQRKNLVQSLSFCSGNQSRQESILIIQHVIFDSFSQITSCWSDVQFANLSLFFWCQRLENFVDNVRSLRVRKENHFLSLQNLSFRKRIDIFCVKVFFIRKKRCRACFQMQPKVDKVLSLI